MTAVSRGIAAVPLALLLCALLAYRLAPAAAQTSTNNVYATPAKYICSNEQLSTLCRVIRAAGEGEGAANLQDKTAIETVFAPTDDAFDKDSKSVASQLKLKDFADIFTTPTAADRLLRGLIVPNQALLSSAFKSGSEYKNMLKQDLEYTTAWFTSQIYIEGARQAEITTKDTRAGQAVIHVVNRVPYP